MKDICPVCKKYNEIIILQGRKKECKICSQCLTEAELAFTYHINGKEVVKEDFNRIKALN